MEPSAWIGILAGVVLALGLGAWALDRWRKSTEQSENWDRILDLIEDVILALEKETRRALREIPQSEVEAAARAVYDRFVAPTFLATFVSPSEFVSLVVERWRALAGVGTAVANAVEQVQRLATGSPALPGPRAD